MEVFHWKKPTVFGCFSFIVAFWVLKNGIAAATVENEEEDGYFFPHFSHQQQHHLRHHHQHQRSHGRKPIFGPREPPVRRSVREIISPGNNIDLLTNITWPYKMAADMDGDIVLGGLHMVHERNEIRTCGPIMAQGGIQAMETMLFTIDLVNKQPWWIQNVTLGAHVLDDCDTDTYGLERAVDFIKEMLLT